MESARRVQGFSNERIVRESYVSGVQISKKLEFLKPFFSDPEVTEICINRPHEVFIQKRGAWSRHEYENLTFEECDSICKLVASNVPQIGQIDEKNAIASGSILDNYRIQVVYPPACESKTISITIRKPSFRQFSLDDLENGGFFRDLASQEQQAKTIDEHLMELLKLGQYKQFYKDAVRAKKTIFTCGETGSGKTTLMKALVQEIPATERLITIEDTPELFLPTHPNHVHLFYSTEAKKDDTVNPQTLLRSCMRMKPDRILLAEARGAEALDLLNVMMSGHAGTMTSIHAGSPETAFIRMTQLIAQNPASVTLNQSLLLDLLKTTVDIVEHQTGEGGYHHTGIWFRPYEEKKRLLDSGRPEEGAKQVARAIKAMGKRLAQAIKAENDGEP